jgi:hypothetical protein
VILIILVLVISEQPAMTALCHPDYADINYSAILCYELDLNVMAALYDPNHTRISNVITECYT